VKIIFAKNLKKTLYLNMLITKSKQFLERFKVLILRIFWIVKKSR